MNRRRFLGAVPLSALAWNLRSEAKPFPQPAPDSSSDFPLLPPDVGYFTREKLNALVDTSVSLDSIRFQPIVYNFPSWHPSPYMEKLFGKDWTEFVTVRLAHPQFPGHLQPKRPLWGTFYPDRPESFNEANPVWAEREIELAASAGIHAFMIDWYWHMGTQWYHEQLEQGFLKARNCAKLRFAIMWANHNWMNLYPSPQYGQSALLNPQTYSEADMDHITDYCLEHYFRESNYWQLGGQPVFAIFNPDGEAGILKFFGVQKLRQILDRMRNRVAKAGLKGLHIQASSNYVASKTPLKEAGFDSATNYHTFAGGAPGKTSLFTSGAESSIRHWKDVITKLDVPYFPDCPVGWDNSPRYGNQAHIVRHRTADQYELFLQAAKFFVAAQHIHPPAIFLSSWNEWTEDHYLLPDEVHGYSYLEAVRRQFSS